MTLESLSSSEAHIAILENNLDSLKRFLDKEDINPDPIKNQLLLTTAAKLEGRGDIILHLLARYGHEYFYPVTKRAFGAACHGQDLDIFNHLIKALPLPDIQSQISCVEIALTISNQSSNSDCAFAKKVVAQMPGVLTGRLHSIYDPLLVSLQDSYGQGLIRFLDLVNAFNVVLPFYSQQIREPTVRIFISSHIKHLDISYGVTSKLLGKAKAQSCISQFIEIPTSISPSPDWIP